MSMYNDTGWDQKRHEEVCKRNVASVPANAKLFPEVRWTFLEPRDEDKWYGTHFHIPCGKWNSTAEDVMKTFAGKWTLVWSGSRAHHPEVVLRGAKDLLRTTMRIRRQQNCCRK